MMFADLGEAFNDPISGNNFYGQNTEALYSDAAHNNVNEQRLAHALAQKAKSQNFQDPNQRKAVILTNQNYTYGADLRDVTPPPSKEHFEATEEGDYLEEYRPKRRKFDKISEDTYILLIIMLLMYIFWLSVKK